MKTNSVSESRIAIGALTGGPDVEVFGRFHRQLVRLFTCLDGFEFCQAINFYCVYLFVDGGIYAWPGKPGVHSLRLRKAQGEISVKIHITDGDWRLKPLREVKEVVAEYFNYAFSLMAARLIKEKLSFDNESFLAATRAVMSEFLESSTDLAALPGHIEIHKRLRYYMDLRDLAAALGDQIPDLNVREGFRLERDPNDANRVRIRQVT